jgi:cobalamin-dependent methionine synthase I
MLALAEKFRGKEKQTREQDLAWREWPVEKRLSTRSCTASPSSSKRTPRPCG